MALHHYYAAKYVLLAAALGAPAYLVVFTATDGNPYLGALAVSLVGTLALFSAVEDLVDAKLEAAG